MTFVDSTSNGYGVHVSDSPQFRGSPYTDDHIDSGGVGGGASSSAGGASLASATAMSQGEDGAFASLGMHHTAVRYLSWSSALLLSQLYALEQVSLYRNEVEGVSAEAEWQQWSQWHSNTHATTTPRATSKHIFAPSDHSAGSSAQPSSSGATADAPSSSSAIAPAAAVAATNAKALAFILVYVHEAHTAADAEGTTTSAVVPNTQTYSSITDAFDALYYPNALLDSAYPPTASGASTKSGYHARHGRTGRAGASVNTTTTTSSGAGVNGGTKTMSSSEAATAPAALDEDLPLPSDVHEAFRLFFRLAQKCTLPALQVLLVRRRRRLGAGASSARRGSHRHSPRVLPETADVDSSVRDAAHGFGKDDNGAPLFRDEPSGEQAASCVLQLLLGLAFSCPCASLAAAAQLVLAEALACLGQDGFHLHSLHGFLRGLPVLVRTSAGAPDPTPSTATTNAGTAPTSSAKATRPLAGATRGLSTLPPLPHTTSSGTVAESAVDGPTIADLDDNYLLALEKVIRHEQDRVKALTPPSPSSTTNASAEAGRTAQPAASSPSQGTTPATLHMWPGVDHVVWVDRSGQVHRQPMQAWLNGRRDPVTKTASTATAAQVTVSTPEVRTRALCAPLPSTTALSTVQRLVLPAASRDVGGALQLQVALDGAVESSRTAHQNALRRAQAVPGATKALRRKKRSMSSGVDSAMTTPTSTTTPTAEQAAREAAAVVVPRRQQLLRLLAHGHLFLTRPMRLSANELLFQAFADGGECPGYYHLLALQPEVLKAHRDTSAHLFTGEGPLPIDLRLMLAVMIASRHRCEYLVARYSALLMRYASMELQPQYDAPTRPVAVAKDDIGASGGATGAAGGVTAAMTTAGGAIGKDHSHSGHTNVTGTGVGNSTDVPGSSAPPPPPSAFDDVDDDTDAVHMLRFDDDVRTSAGNGHGQEEAHKAARAVTGGPSGVAAHRSTPSSSPGSREAEHEPSLALPYTREADASMSPSATPAGAIGSAAASATASPPSAVKVKERWLTQGPPARLRAAQHLIALAAHTPWLVHESDMRALLHRGWTVPELFQLMAIIAHVLPLCSFVMGLYVASEPWVSTVLPLSVSRRLQHRTVANSSQSNNNNISGQSEEGWATDGAGQAEAVAATSQRVPVTRTVPGTGRRPHDAHYHANAYDEDLEDATGSTEGDDVDESDEDAAAGPDVEAADPPRDLYVLYAGEEDVVSEQRIKGAATNHHALWRSQFNWFELGTTLMEQYYPGAAGLLNAEMDAVLDLSRRLSDVDCVGLKTSHYTPEYALRSLQLYVCNLIGYMTEDYPYNDINKVLRRPAKWFAQVLTVRPEILTRDDVVRWHGALSTPSGASGGGGGGGGPPASLMTATSTSNNQSTIANTPGAAAAVTCAGLATAAALTHSLRRENELLAGAGSRTSTSLRGFSMLRDGSAGAATTTAATSATGHTSTTMTRTRSPSPGKQCDNAAGEEEEDSAEWMQQVEEAALLQSALSIQDERVLWLTALATMEARREGLLHILMHPLCSVVQNL